MSKAISLWAFYTAIIINVFFISLQASESSHCMICLGNDGSLITLHKPEPATADPHVCHKECVKPWLAANPTCPTCRCAVPAESLITPLTEDQKARFWVSVGINATLSGITLWATDDRSWNEWISDTVAENAVDPVIKMGLRTLVASTPLRRSLMTQRIINYVSPQIAFWGTACAIMGKKGCRDKIDKLIFYSAIKSVRVISDFILRSGYDANLYERKINNDSWLLKKVIQVVPFGVGFFFLQSPAIEYVGIGKQHIMMQTKLALKMLNDKAH